MTVYLHFFTRSLMKENLIYPVNSTFDLTEMFVRSGSIRIRLYRDRPSRFQGYFNQVCESAYLPRLLVAV